MIFDTLSQLETYVPVVPAMAHVITVMDRSLPYERKDGTYACDEDESVSYQVTSAMSSKGGFEFEVKKGEGALVIALDGEEVVSDMDASSVFILCEGRFLLLGEGRYRRGISTNLPSRFRDVVFTFPMK